MTTILIVDDLDQNRYMLESLLKATGYTALLAENGAVALELAQSEPVDLVISDILMPVMDGFDLCRRMKTDEHLKSIPFIFYTATYTEPKHERFALSLGAERFITKPQQPADLLTMIQEVLNEGHPHREEVLDESIDSEMAFLRQHNEALFTKLDKKTRDLQRLSDLHILLYQINRAIRSAKSEATLLEEACRLCVDYGKFDLARIGWVPQPGKALRADLLAGPLAEYLQDLEIPTDPNHGPSASSLQTDRIAVSQDWSTDPAKAPWRSRAEPYGIRSSATLPISIENQAVAILNLYSIQPGFFTQDRLHLIEELAQDLSYAIRSLAEIRQREEAERALVAQEMEYRAAFEQGAVGMVQVAIDGRILRVNRRICEILDRSPGEMVGHHFHEFTHPEDREPDSGLFQSLADGSRASFHFQKRYLRKDGQILWGEVSGGPVRNPEGRVLYLLSALNDITDRKADEQRLLEEKAKLQTLIQTIPDLIWLKDPDGVYQFCNHRFEAFFGKPESDILGKTDYHFVDRDLADWFQKHDRLAMEAEEPCLNEEWVTFASDGHRELLETIKTPMKDASGRLIGVLGISRDVTGNRMDQERLRKLSKAIEQSPVVVVITDLAGTIEYVNPRFTELTGYSPEEAIGANPRILKSGVTPPEVYAGLWSTILAGRVWHGEFQNQKKNGERYWETISISPILNEAGTITHFVALKEDITHLKRVQTELQEQLSELQRWHEATLGRETRVLDLKREVNELLARMGEGPRYESVNANDSGDSGGDQL